MMDTADTFIVYGDKAYRRALVRGHEATRLSGHWSDCGPNSIEITQAMVAAGAAALEQYPFNGEEPLQHSMALLVAREVLEAAGKISRRQR